MNKLKTIRRISSVRQGVNLTLLNWSNRNWRQSRIERFIELIHPTTGMTILDLGGSGGGLLHQIVRTAGISAGRLIVADIDPAIKIASQVFGFETVVLQEGIPLPFADGEIDVVWCNSVIEHVTPGTNEMCLIPGKISDREWRSGSYFLQKTFASEIRRISKSYFVQTPNRRFPVEAHTAIPFAGYLSHNSTLRVVRLLRKFWPRPIGYVDWNLLSVQDMRVFFYDGNVETEKFLGISKSIIAWKKE